MKIYKRTEKSNVSHKFTIWVLIYFIILCTIGVLRVNALSGNVQGRTSILQGIVVNGIVTDVSGKPLQGVNIVIKGTLKGVVSDVNGNFSIAVPDENALLVISFIGYATLEIPAGNELVVTLQEDAKMIGEVVVSTQKRMQSSIEVPAAISALVGRSLNNLNVQQLDELSEYIPGMQMQLQSPNNPSYVIRGVTSDNGDSRSQPRVSVFQDGISISRSRASVVELFDLERIEVVKGPQGTLFGRGAEIGALHIIRNKPGNKFEGEIAGKYGTYNQMSVNGYLNTPIIREKLANRFSFIYDRHDGFIENRSGGGLNGKEVYALRNSTRLFIGNNSFADLVLDYQHDNYPGTSFKNGSYAPAGGNTDPNTMADLEQGENLYIKRDVGGATLLFDHRFNANWNLSSITGFRAFHSDESFDADGTAAPILWVSEIAKGTQWSQELRFNYDNRKRFSGFFGASYFYENNSQEVPMRINEQSLYPAYISPMLRNMVGDMFKSYNFLPAAQVDALTGILFPAVPTLSDGVPNYVTNVSNIRGILEAAFSQQIGFPVTLEQAFTGAGLDAATQAQLIGLVDLLSNAPINVYHEESSTNFGINNALEIFADGTYKLTDRLGLTAGLRFTYEYQKAAYEAAASQQPSVFGMLLTNSPNLLNLISNGKIWEQRDYYSYVGRLALNYMIKRNNIFAGISRGRRPGVINVLPNNVTYLDPEIIWSYEAGIKGVVANGKLNYDFSAFYYDWNHFQTVSIETINNVPQYVADDAGKAHSLGIETGLVYSLIQNISVFGNYAYIDGKFNDTDENGNPQEYAGNRFRLTPEHTFSIGLDANLKLKGGYTVFLRPAYSYKSKVFFEDNNRPDLSQDAYGLTNVTTGVRLQKNKVHYELSLYGKNVFDIKYIIDAGNSGDTIGMPTYIGGSPSLFGLMVKIGF